jgi:predicted DNA-binding antitoxin AbrB/MazE fold protein
MREQIEVVYENGSFRPLGRLPAHLREHQRLTVTIEASPEADD